MKTPLRALLLLALALPACHLHDHDDGSGDAGPDAAPRPDQGLEDLADATFEDPDAAGEDPDAAVPDAGPTTPPDTATLRFEPVFPVDMWTQLHPLYRQLGGPESARARGRFYAELCATPDCPDPIVVPLGADFGPFGSVNGPAGATIEQGALPGREATWYLRLFLDTDYSRELGAAVDDEGGAGNFDVYASGGALDGQPCTRAADCIDGAIVDRHNPAPRTYAVTLTDGETTDLGRVVFGSVRAEIETPTPAPGTGYLLVAASGTGGRNAVYAIDERDGHVEDGDLATLDGVRFEGDFCGFVRGAGDDLWVLGFGARDGYVFRYDTRARAFAADPPIVFPAPAENDARVSLCRGAYLDVGGRGYLVLIEYEGAGALDTAQSYPLAVVEVTDPAAPRARLYGPDEGLFAGSVSPVLRGVATDGEQVFLLSPSWRTRSDGQSKLYTVMLKADGTPLLIGTTDAGVADDRCSATFHFVPALAVAEMAGAPRVFVGTDERLDIYDAGALADGLASGPLGSIDTTGYGTLPTTIAAGVGDRRLYVMPNCKSDRIAFLDGRRANRHAVAIVDLDSDPEDPRLVETERRFDDEDGGPTGGLDLAFLALKRAVLRWYPDAVLPPVAYTGPQIAVGTTALYLRGAGISLDNDAPEELRAAGVSGLGQAGDIGVVDLATGEGSLSRPDYTIWFDGPSAEWGLKLRPAGTPGASTGALVWIPGDSEQ